MIAADYIKHFKVLGKLCRMWDDAVAEADDQKQRIARLYDQAATGELPSYPTLLVLNPFTSTLDAAVKNGADAIKATAKSMTEAYLKATLFTDDLTTSPIAPVTAKSVLEALQTEMSAGVDNVTLTTLAATGLVNFFDTNWSPTNTWNTLADASATYKDSVYVVDTIV